MFTTCVVIPQCPVLRTRPGNTPLYVAVSVTSTFLQDGAFMCAI